MYFLLRHRLAAAILALVIAAGILLTCRRHRVNYWELKNYPPQPGRIVCFGDSLTHGVGASAPSSTFPVHLERILQHPVAIYGYPGATTEAALATLRTNAQIRGSVVIVTLGGNDFLRRMPLPDTINNLETIFRLLQERGALVVYTGVPNGRTGNYRKLCKRTGVLLVPEILDGIIGNPAFKADRIHPNDKGYKLIAQRIAEVLKENLPQETDSASFPGQSSMPVRGPDKRLSREEALIIFREWI